jgi:hypothetical protein
MGAPLPPAQHAIAGNSLPFQFVSPSSLTLNSMSSVQSTASAGARRLTGAQWLAANQGQINAALQNITDSTRVAALISDRTFDLYFPSWVPLRRFLADLGASIVLFNPTLLDRNHIWDPDLMVAAANEAVTLAMSVVPWDLDPGKRRVQISYLMLIICTAIRDHLGSVIVSIQDTLLEIRDYLKEGAEGCSEDFGFLKGATNSDHNQAAFQLWHRHSAYIHRWRDGVSTHKFLQQPPLIILLTGYILAIPQRSRHGFNRQGLLRTRWYC